jgi:hypothetical protein
MAETAIRLGDVSIPDLIKKLDTDGVVCLENAISSTWLKAARATLPKYMARYGAQDFLVADVGDEADTPSHELVNDPVLRELFAEVAQAGWPLARHASSIRNGLTVRSGPVRKAPGMLFHYDASVVTMVVPIFIPDGERGDSGELVAIPNKRPFRRFLVSHTVDKLLTHNSWYRRRVARKALREPGEHIVDLKPGNAYLFWGYRTLHGNLPCAPGLLRSTLILQYGEVHRPSPALALARAIGRRKVRKMQVLAA